MASTSLCKILTIQFRSNIIWHSSIKEIVHEDKLSFLYKADNRDIEIVQNIQDIECLLPFFEKLKNSKAFSLFPMELMEFFQF